MVASWSLMAFVASTTLKRWLKIAGPGLWIGCLMVGATLVMGTTVNGASRWLVIGPIQVQPSELVKPFVVLQAANLFAHWKRTHKRRRENLRPGTETGIMKHPRRS